MAATLTSVAGGATVTSSSFSSFVYIGSQSFVTPNGSGTGIAVRTPSGDIIQFTNADMDAASADEAAQTLVAALNTGGSTPVAAKIYRAFITQTSTNAPVLTEVENTTGLTFSGVYEAAGEYKVVASGAITAWFPVMPLFFENIVSGVQITANKVSGTDFTLLSETGAQFGASGALTDGLISAFAFGIQIFD